MFRERNCYQHKLQVNLLFDQTGHPTPGQHDRLWYWESENCHFVHLLQKKIICQSVFSFYTQKNYSWLFLCAVAFTVFFTVSASHLHTILKDYHLKENTVVDDISLQLNLRVKTNYAPLQLDGMICRSINIDRKIIFHVTQKIGPRLWKYEPNVDCN